MSDAAQTKVCPMCAETIRAAAKLCPHCRHVQVKWNLFAPNITAVVVMVFWLAAILGVMILIGRVIGRQNAEPYLQQFAILESTVSQRITSNATYVVITGTLTNGSDYSWRNIALEGQVFDSKSNLVDVIPAPSDYYTGSIAPAHGVAAFKIESRTGRTPAEYATHKVFVRWAKDATSWP
jgi:hypothetical protein